jgi:hypothetical protein
VSEFDRIEQETEAGISETPIRREEQEKIAGRPDAGL